ncbi:NAD-dependent succinate-semialdehyde dehydrogenase [Anoxynatronum buryatiense]|uniref:Succinate semialdehyde dehydrogenase n=1 Tax=Anoxynatronum buryatiense TaxID=489973 RepID=A0AA45WTN8_9CLOT|nr:NAD-dependent succinate-semialdehyde dehydrogenase [Anoxynatronum buryatiense]SMP44156.1 succinate semialdehyde dehydrogenase [Anoxynatronum buryatiense]
MEEKKLYINGEWVKRANDDVIQVLNPASGEVVGTVPNAGREEVMQAVDAASKAFDTWAALPARRRAEYLRRWFDLMREHKESIARTLTLEQGKPLAEARGEVAAAGRFLEWYSEEAVRVAGEIIPPSGEKKRIMVLRQPVGVVAAITPWNFPASMVTRKIAPALAAGCPVILKPASQTPLTAVAIVELAHEAGIPRGVVNLVTGSAALIGETLMADSRVRKITFTGSTEVGKMLMRQSADTMKRISLELGGHAPYLVFDDADLEQAVAGVIQAKIRNAGQMCVAVNRFFVQEGIYDAFVSRLRTALKQIQTGNGLDESVTMGPLIDHKAYQKVLDHVLDARELGAGLLCGGNGRHEGGHPEAGYFFEPTLLTNVTDQMKIMQEETFGPVLPLRRFETEEEALLLANDSRYGLAAYVYTQSLSRGIRVSEKLQYGVVGLNDGGPATVQAPFGGFKESGIGREGGHHGMEPFLEIKYISIGL